MENVIMYDMQGFPRSVLEVKLTKGSDVKIRKYEDHPKKDPKEDKDLMTANEIKFEELPIDEYVI